MKLLAILREVSDQQSRDMVTGIADILRDVKDKGNREEIAKRMIKKFDREGVKYDAKEFMKMCDLKDVSERRSLQEIGEATADPYPLEQTLKRKSLDRYEFTTDTGNQYEIMIDKETDGSETDYEVAFAVLQRGEVMFPGHQPPRRRNFEKEVNDPKNLFRVMATVIAAIKKSLRSDERSGLTVTRVIMNPTKKDRSDTRRTQLYKKYIENHMPPGSVVYVEPDGSRIQVDLPRR